MKFTINNSKGIAIPYQFPNKKKLKQYIEICEQWCGGAPVDVTWAMQTKPYLTIKLLNTEKYYATIN